MLSFLRVRGLALLDDVTLELGAGLAVLTGETGAGKSILVDALALLRGGRGRVDLVRAGASAALVDAEFQIDAATAAFIDPVLAAHGLPPSDGAVVLQRSLPLSGRGRCLVQGELTTQAVLAEVGELLLDICSQHEFHSLTRVAHHLDLLDGYARLDALREEQARAWRALAETRAALAGLRARAAEAGARASFLRFQLDELERVAPEPGEHERVTARIRLLRDARTWAELCREVMDELCDGEGALQLRAARLADRARRGQDQSPRLAALAEQLEAARVACEEAGYVARRFAEELEFEPGELDRAEERLHALEGLRRKHGVELGALGEREAALREELGTLDDLDGTLAALERREAGEHAAALGVAERLHAERARAAAALGEALSRELTGLHLPAARLSAALTRLSDDELGPRGLDRAEFLFSANPGEPLAPLSRVASGGELSRVLLALKGVLATGDRVATYVFDEVDAGVGGAVAEAIGERLRSAAGAHQVLCITHLPQIAAFAGQHFHVEKHELQGRTVTGVKRLSDEERVEELARMLGGARVGATAREHARELLKQGRAAAARPRGAPDPPAGPGGRARSAGAKAARARSTERRR